MRCRCCIETMHPRCSFAVHSLLTYQPEAKMCTKNTNSKVAFNPEMMNDSGNPIGVVIISPPTEAYIVLFGGLFRTLGNWNTYANRKVRTIHTYILCGTGDYDSMTQDYNPSTRSGGRNFTAELENRYRIDL